MMHQLNAAIIKLNGVPFVSVTQTLNNSRLEPYALVVLFYMVSKEFPQLTYDAVLPLILRNAPLHDILSL